ncbi:MAG: transposase, partial [bacterium]
HDLFGVSNALSEKRHKILECSVEHVFFINVFSKIRECDFKILYSSKKSRPNVPVNQLVAALILKHLYNWTYNELFRNLNFNVLTRHAIGIQTLGEDIFSEASIFNFQNRIIEYYLRSGKDLLTEIFDSLTREQLREFGVKTDIQRGDSFLIGSNIFDYSRLQLLIEILLRLYRIFEKEDIPIYSKLLEDYTKQTSGQYVYKIHKEDLPKEIEQLAKIYHDLYITIEKKYRKTSAFSIFKRVYNEHFVVLNKKIKVIPSGQLNSGILMSPDDETATFHKKREICSKGYCGHISETSNPENKFNLITDIEIKPNNISDSKILEDRIPEMVRKTPELKEYHTDGGYGSPKVDELMEGNKINQIQTSISGRKAYAKISIIEADKNEYWATCEFGQKVKAEKTARNWRAVFDNKKCLSCPLNQKCATKKHMGKTKKSNRIWYFTLEKIRLHKREQYYEKLPDKRKTLRANVEATVKEVKRGVKNGKVRIRCMVRIKFYLSMTSIAVNLT